MFFLFINMSQKFIVTTCAIRPRLRRHLMSLLAAKRQRQAKSRLSRLATLLNPTVDEVVVVVSSRTEVDDDVIVVVVVVGARHS